MTDTDSVAAAAAVPPDGGHGWLIVVASFLVYAISGGMFYAQGILYPEFVMAFDAGEATTAWVCSIMMGLCLLTAMVSGWFLDSVGHRTLCVIGSFLAGMGFIVSSFVHNLSLFFLTYSVTIGVGMGIQFIATLMIIPLYFDKKRAIATGITVSGSPAGGVVFAPLTQFFIDKYGWRSTMLLIGAIALNACALAILMAPQRRVKRKVPSFPDLNTLEPPEPRPLSRLRVDMGSVLMQSIENMKSAISLELNETETESKCQLYAKKLAKVLDFSVLKQFIVLVVLCNWFLFTMGFMVPYVFLPLYTAEYGIDPITSARILSVMGIADFVGRIIFGIVGNCACCNSVHLFGGCAMMAGLSCICSLLASTTPTFYLLGIAVGFAGGGWVCTSSVSLAELLGVENLAKSYGIMQIAGSLAFFMSSPLHAFMLEATNDIRVPFISAGVMEISGGVILLLYYHTCYNKSSQNNNNPVEDFNNEEDTKKDIPNVTITLPTDNFPLAETDSFCDIAIVA